MVSFAFSVFDRFPFFWVNLVQKIKIVGLNWNLVRRLICICKNNRDVHFSCYWLKIPFLGKFSPKNQKCEFKIKIDTNTISNMQNSLILFTFFKLEILFLSKFSPKIQNYLFKVKFGPRLIRICKIQLVMFTFSVWDRKYPS